ncbi:MAG: hypothetical protein E4G94_00105 [ANME-2 cluster archaeon]|nr:MAG: hypothetical protein E4G94_00105 [ANME-2 cluster archaeon]
MKDRAIKQLERFSLGPDFMRNMIVILIIFSVFFLVLSDATGLNSNQSVNQTINSGNETNISESEIGIDLLNNSIESQISERQTFTFGSLTVLDSIFNPIFCLITLYDTDGIVKISDTNSLIIDTINPGSHLYI